MKLTQKIIDKLAAQKTRYEVADDVVPGLKVRVSVTGLKTFCLVYRMGKSRDFPKKRLTIGNYPKVSLEEARLTAKRKNALIELGKDPSEELKKSKSRAKQAKKDKLTLEKLFSVFIEQHKHKRKPKTCKHYEDIMKVHVFPVLGKKAVKEITHRDISSLHHKMHASPYQANRMLAVVSVFYTWCQRNEYVEQGVNPALFVEKYKEHAKKNFLQAEQIARLGQAIAKLEQENYSNMSALQAIKLLLFTGARCGEIITLKWEYIDFEHGKAILPDSKTGFKVIQLPGHALDILHTLPRENEYCFAGKGRTGHLINIKDTWYKIVNIADLKGWRIHDLRHAFASYAAIHGMSLPVIGAMLGHTQVQTTARYAHLCESPIARAAEKTANLIFKDFCEQGKEN